MGWFALNSQSLGLTPCKIEANQTGLMYVGIGIFSQRHKRRVSTQQCCSHKSNSGRGTTFCTGTGGGGGGGGGEVG